MQIDDSLYVSPEPDNVLRNRRQRNLLRSTVPVVFVVLILAAVLSIAYFSYRINKRAVLMLSNDLLNSLNRRVCEEVESYMSPAAHMVEIVGEMIKDENFLSERSHEIDSLTSAIIRTYPQLASFPVADTRGNFLMAKKMSDGAIHTKRIEWLDGLPLVSWVQRNTKGAITGTEKNVDASYDPRVRAWYKGAVGKKGLFWTDVYIFHSDKKPGITASYPIRDSGGRILGALGLDFSLDNLSHFLKTLRIGKTGIALILNNQGQVIAFPNPSRMMINEKGTLRPRSIKEMGDPTLLRAFNHYRISGHGHYSFNMSGIQYISMMSSLPKTMGKDWSVLMVVPEDDFVGLVSSNNRNTLLLSLVIVAISAVLAILFTLQSFRADKNAQMVSKWRRQLETQSTAFSQLTGKPAIFDPHQPEGMAQITEIAAEVFNVERVGVWHLENENQMLVSEDIYRRENSGHTQGLELQREQYPGFLTAVESGVFLIITHAAEDPRTAELKETYLKTLGTVSMLLAPLFLGDRVCGVLTFEKVDARTWSPEEMNFAEAVAGIISTRFSFGEHDKGRTRVQGEESRDHVQGEKQEIGGHGAPGQDAVETTDATLAPEQEETPDPPLDRQPSHGDLEPFPEEDEAGSGTKEMTVLYAELRIHKAIAEGKSFTDALDFIEKLTLAIGSLAGRHGITVQRMTGDTYICMSGATPGTANHAHVIAEMAMDMQHRCAHLFDEESLPMWARFGISTGPVILQRDERGGLLNFWGETVSSASIMASYGIRGEIQVAETSYALLKADFLLQDRGSFFVEGQGEITTYLLSGRL
ncbi:adenylate/guanylate cyclase domain-containing protein [Thermodesulfobacteriota bacterium]